MLMKSLPGRVGLASPRFLAGVCLTTVLGVGAVQLHELCGELRLQVLYLEKESITLERVKLESKRNWTRMKAGEQLVRDLASGNLGLSAAARQFCDLYARGPSVIWKLVREESGRTDSERLCLYLISLAERSVKDPKRQAIRIRLETELQESATEIAELAVPEPIAPVPQPHPFEPGERDLLERAWFLLNLETR